VWIEPDEPQHPLTGIVHALRNPAQRPVLVLPVDLPLMDAATLRLLLDTDPGDAVAVLASADGRLQPLCGLYRHEALAALQSFDPRERTVDIVRAAGVVEVSVPDPVVLTNVNAPEDVLCASALRAERSARSAAKPRG
jgi:molybdopterin-guanine dinucleotide biosynthesis protein A